MKKYITPEIELVMFSGNDVLVSSSVGTTTRKPENEGQWSAWTPSIDPRRRRTTTSSPQIP